MLGQLQPLAPPLFSAPVLCRRYLPLIAAVDDCRCLPSLILISDGG
jgi:hypothetical protein